MASCAAGALLPGTFLRAADPAPGEIVVAMRYFQGSGTSHSHLYLYREDGKLLRQLTADNTGQDYAPLFSPDGETIVFSRRSDTGGTDHYSVEPRGGHLRSVAATQDWNQETKETASFGYLDDDPDEPRLFTNDSEAVDVKPVPRGEPPTYRAPDSSVELMLKVSPDNEEDNVNGEGHGKSYLLRDLKSGESVTMGKLPGFVGLVNLLALGKDPGQRFLLTPPLRVAFFGLHLDSTNGDTVFALDLSGKKLVRLSPNWAAPIPLPGEAAFLTFTLNCYVPFGDGKKTANSSYVERWTVGLRPVRFAQEKAAGVCYGASLYRPGKIPAVVRIKGEDVPVPDEK